MRGSTHIMADGSNKVQYAVNDKHIFNIMIDYVQEDTWDDILTLKQLSKIRDLTLTDHEGKEYNVRFIPETLNKSPITGTALGYNITFSLIEV